LIIPELIARIGNRWTLAANKSLVANIMRRIVVAHNVDHLGVGWPIWIQLFEHTPPDDSEMMYVKETVFGAKGGKPNNLWVNIL
jgi:hypothetical protein